MQSAEDFVDALYDRDADADVFPDETMPLELAVAMAIDPRRFDGLGLGQGALLRLV